MNSIVVESKSAQAQPEIVGRRGYKMWQYDHDQWSALLASGKFEVMEREKFTGPDFCYRAPENFYQLSNGQYFSILSEVVNLFDDCPAWWNEGSIKENEILCRVNAAGHDAYALRNLVDALDEQALHEHTLSTFSNQLVEKPASKLDSIARECSDPEIIRAAVEIFKNRDDLNNRSTNNDPTGLANCNYIKQYREILSALGRQLAVLTGVEASALDVSAARTAA